jgi:hypothetical protein
LLLIFAINIHNPQVKVATAGGGENYFISLGRYCGFGIIARAVG